MSKIILRSQNLARQAVLSIRLKRAWITKGILLNEPKVSISIKPLHYISRNYCSKMALEKHAVDYNYVANAKDNPEVLVVDVREPDEVKASGKIPNSVNIPLGEVEQMLKKSPEAFKQQLNVEKPGKNAEVIFYCQAGKRAANAAQKALDLGFNNPKVYLGSWSDWSSRQ